MCCFTGNTPLTAVSFVRLSVHFRSILPRTLLSVSICTDNRLISNATLSHELELVTRGLGLTRYELRNLVIAGFKGSFFHGPNHEKRAYIRQVTDHYAQVEKNMLPALRSIGPNTRS